MRFVVFVFDPALTVGFETLEQCDAVFAQFVFRNASSMGMIDLVCRSLVRRFFIDFVFNHQLTDPRQERQPVTCVDPSTWQRVSRRGFFVVAFHIAA